MLHQMPPLFHLCITPCCMLHAAGCTPSGFVKAAAVKLPARPRWVAARCPFCFGGGCAAAPPRSHGLLCVGTVRRRSSHGCAPHVCAGSPCAFARGRLLCWLQHGRAFRLSPVVSPMLARCSMAELHAAALADAKAELLALTAAHSALGEQAWHRPARTAEHSVQRDGRRKQSCTRQAYDATRTCTIPSAVQLATKHIALMRSASPIPSLVATSHRHVWLCGS